MADKDPAENDAAALPAPPSGRKMAVLRSLGVLLLMTLIAVGAGGGLGLHLASTVEQTLTAKAKAAAAAVQHPNRPEPKYNGDMVVQALEPVITNLAAPEGIWIRLETAIVYANGALTDPPVSGAEIRQDVLAYARTMTLSQLEGPSALQHLREDLNERVALRTGGLVNELVIQTMIVQ